MVLCRDGKPRAMRRIARQVMPNASWHPLVMSVCLAEPHQFLEIPGWILSDLVYHLGIHAGRDHAGVA